MKAPILAVVAAGLIAGGFAGLTATTASAAGVREARIPFVQYGGIRDWRTGHDDELFVQGRDRRWYHVALMGPCNGLEFANGVRFMPSDSAGTFDRFSWIQTSDQRCKVQSVTAIRGEPYVPNHPRPRGDRS